MSTYITRFVYKISSILSFLIFGILLYFAFTETGKINYDMVEYNYFVKDNLCLNLLLLVLFIYSIHKISNYLCKYRIKHLMIFFMICITILLVYLIDHVNLTPSWDSAKTIQAAVGLINHDYSMFTYGNYISQYPFQVPLVLYYAFFIKIFGENYIILQFINIIFLLCTYFFIIKISFLISHHKKIAIMTLLLLVTFIPLQMYVMFLYSNIPSLFCMTTGIYFFLNHYQNHEYKNIILSFVFLGLATLFKGTAYIVVIAVIIMYILELLHKFNLKKIAIIVISTLILLITPTQINKAVSSLNPSISLSSTAYKEIALVMGTSYGPRGAGWHNGWYEPKLYKMYGNDVQAMKKDGQKRTINNLKELYTNHKLLSFYHDKICSMYINPDYQGFWTIVANKTQQFGQGDSNKQSFLFIKYDPSTDQYSHFTSSFMTGKINQGIIAYENVLMNAIYLGCICFIYFNQKTMTKEKIFIPIIFIGCFLFFLAWEAKAQYSILFYILLFPIAAEGINHLISHFNI